MVLSICLALLPCSPYKLYPSRITCASTTRASSSKHPIRAHPIQRNCPFPKTQRILGTFLVPSTATSFFSFLVAAAACWSSHPPAAASFFSSLIIVIFKVFFNQLIWTCNCIHASNFTVESNPSTARAFTPSARCKHRKVPSFSATTRRRRLLPSTPRASSIFIL